LNSGGDFSVVDLYYNSSEVRESISLGCTNIDYVEYSLENDVDDGSCLNIACVVPGDANTDGDLNVLDVVTMVSHILGTLELEAEQISCSDLNQDGSINVIDIVMAVAIIMEN
jgi:hypothetical protein